MDTSTDNKCKEPSFNHFTINTGHNLVQTQQYFLNHPVSNAILKKLAQESLTPEGVEVIENVRFQSKARDGAYCGTVFSPVDGKAIPLLISFGARTEEAGQRIWMDITDHALLLWQISFLVLLRISKQLNFCLAG